MTVKSALLNTDSPARFYYLHGAARDLSSSMTSSLIWVLIGVYVGFFIFLQKVMKDS